MSNRRFLSFSLQIHLFLACFLLKNASATAQLNFYYGNIHSHSGYSDGNQDSVTSLHSTPAQDFAYAKSSLHFDFLGISDHNHSTVGMTLAKYHAGVAQAVAATDANFVALYGMEWGVTTGTGNGHVLIYGIDSLIGWQSGVYDIYNAQADYAGLFAKINARPASLLSLAHPQTGDFNDIEGSAYSSATDNAVSGVSIRSGYAFSTTTNYTDNPATIYETYFKTLLSKGYHLAPSIDHDNHNTTFGRTLPGRTVVLAASKTKTAILSAIKNMHYFASDDWNAQVTFTITGQIMGNVASIAGDPVISVTNSDPDGETISSIEIWYGTPGSNALPTVLTSNTNSSSLTYTHAIALGQTRYYYAKIKQIDGDYLWTAPIWVTKTSNLPVELTNFDASAEKTDVRLSWKTAHEINLAAYEIERSLDGLTFEKIGETTAAGFHEYAFRDEKPVRGLLFYRLKMRDHDGSERSSSVVTAFFENNPIEFESLTPNPATDRAELRFTTIAKADELDWTLFDADGHFVKTASFSSKKGENMLEISLDELSAGLYFLLIHHNGQAFLEKKLMVGE